MIVFDNIEEITHYIYGERQAGRTIGFVPTMGALHEGHISLVKRAKEETDIVVVSIFVNPTQFNDPRDLEKYPRTVEKDLSLLESNGVSAVFLPSVETMYPTPDNRVFNVGEVCEVMEGKHRPGHFNGVMQVVSKLFDIVKPDKAFFGEKDFQQIAVIRAMLRFTRQSVEIVNCPIYRAENGLALSSRNSLLSEEQLAEAPKIYEALKDSIEMYGKHSPEEVMASVTETLNSNKFFKVEYFEIVDADTLLPVKKWDDSKHIQGCITVYCGEIRLIDNIKYK